MTATKKRFLRALSKTFALLLYTKVDTAEKRKKILKIAREKSIEIWSEPKSQGEDYLTKCVNYLRGW